MKSWTRRRPPSKTKRPQNIYSTTISKRTKRTKKLLTLPTRRLLASSRKSSPKIPARILIPKERLSLMLFSKTRTRNNHGNHLDMMCSLSKIRNKNTTLKHLIRLSMRRNRNHSLRSSNNSRTRCRKQGDKTLERDLIS